MRPGGGRHRSPRLTAFGGGSVIAPLIWANVIIFLFSGFGQSTAFIDLLKLHPHYIRGFQFWRFGTYMFAHGNFMHILFNMWGVYVFGRPLEARLGSARFLNLYFISGLVGGGVWLLFNLGLTSEAVAISDGRLIAVSAPGGVIGASGAVFGVMMAAAMTFPNEIIVLLLPPIPMRLKTFVAVYAGIEVMMALNRGGGRIAHIAHLGGILGGFLYMRRLRQSGGVSVGWALGRWWRRWRATWRTRRFKLETGGPREEPPANLSAEVDRILDKIGREGLGSLTDAERRALDHARDRLRERD